MCESKVWSKTCDTCGNCVGWHDEGCGLGEYICCLPDSETEYDQEKDQCTGWISEEEVKRLHKICFRLKNDVPIGILDNLYREYGCSIEIEQAIPRGVVFSTLMRRDVCWEFIEENKQCLSEIYDKYAKDMGIDYIPKGLVL